MEQAIVKVSDKTWIAVGGSIYHNFCEMCGCKHDQPYIIYEDKDGDKWTLCQECKDKMEEEAERNAIREWKEDV